MFLTLYIRRIRALGFWPLKRGFRRIYSSSAQKCTQKVRFYKPCTSAASESKFDHANRIPCLKVGVLVHSVKVSQTSRLTTDCFSYSIGRFTDRFVVAKQTVKQTAQLCCP